MDTKFELFEEKDSDTNKPTKEAKHNIQMGLSADSQPIAQDEIEEPNSLPTNPDSSNLNDPNLATVHRQDSPETPPKVETEGHTIQWREGKETREGKIKTPPEFKPGGPER